jgi:hypothetical protein
MTSWLIPVLQTTLTPARYGELADVPPEFEWLANITNPKTRRAYTRDVAEFSPLALGLNPRDCGPSRARMSLPGARIWKFVPYPTSTSNG